MLNQCLGKRDKRSISSDRRGTGHDNNSRTRRSSNSPRRDHKIDKDRSGGIGGGIGGTSRENKNSYTSATGIGSSGRDRDLRRTTDNPAISSGVKDYQPNSGRGDSDNRDRDFHRTSNDRFEQRGKSGRDNSKDRAKE